MSLKERAAEILGVSGSEVRELTRSAPESSPLTRHSLRIQNATPESLKSSHARTKFGKPAITRIFRAAGALDRYDEDRSNYLFLTATLPGDTVAAKWAIAEYSHKIIDLLKSWLSKRLLSRNEFYVWEHQERGALHFHYCLHCPDKAVQREIATNFKTQMVRIYDRIEAQYSCDLWGRWGSCSNSKKLEVLQARVEVVYGRVGSYMAGYLANSEQKHARDELHCFYPKRWFGVSRPLSALIASMTEKVEHEFDSLKAASEFYEAKKEDISENALTIKPFPHKVGEGKTTVFFHTPEIQRKLWESQKMVIHPPRLHPNISAYISLALNCIQQLRTALQKSKRLRGKLPISSVLFLEDATVLPSLRNGALNRRVIKELEKIYSCYDFSSDSQCQVSSCFHNLRKFTLHTSKYHSSMRFSPNNWLRNEQDFPDLVDNLPKSSYRGTTAEEPETPNGLDGSRAHVASELGPHYSQVQLW